MITTLLIVLGLLIPMQVAAENELFSELSSSISSSCISFDYSYRTEVKGTVFTGRGKVTARYPAFRAEGNGFLIVCDGETKWTSDIAAKERAVRQKQQQRASLLAQLKKQEEALAYYRALYIKDGLFDCEMYEGIDTLVKSLKEAGARVGVATSKKENFAVMVLEKLGLYQHLDFVSGFAENRTDKTQVICHAIETYGIDKDKCLMIGDTFYDLQGAQNAGIDAVGILYGFGSKEDMLKFPHVAILETVKDLSDFVLQKVDKLFTVICFIEFHNLIISFFNES